MPVSAGEKLGPYELLSPIGEGGMGEVWKALDTRLDRIVAIKFSKDQFTERFEREARAVAALNHPNICQLYDVGPNYLVMEFIEGTPLAGPVTVEKAVEQASQILDALDAAHRKGITHRDLKPANILLTRQGIKLLDFGLAKRHHVVGPDDKTVAAAITNRGEILGTLQYMSPEQLQGKDVDSRSDLFSFGCVLYEMLTGKRAFEGENGASLIASILEREPAPLVAAPRLERIVRRSLAKDRDQRFQTARDLRAALTWAMDQTASFGASERVRPWQWVAAVAALVIGMLAGRLALSHVRRPHAEVPVFRLQIEPPEGGQFLFGGITGGVALSPDGRTAAFVASSKGKTELWIRPLDGMVARPIAGSEEARFPFWSPDSKSLAFFTSSHLKRVDLSGGSPSLICSVAGGRGGAWTGKGQMLFGTESSGLFQVSPSGGKPATLTTLDKSRQEAQHRWPQELPGGRFLFAVQSAKPEYSGIYAGSFAKPEDRVRLLATDTHALYAHGDSTDYLLWMRGGTLVAQEFNASTVQFAGEPRILADPVSVSGYVGHTNATVSGSGVLLYAASNTLSQLTWVDRSGKTIGLVGAPGEYNTLRLSPDGRRVAVSRGRAGATDLWLLDGERREGTPLTLNASLNTNAVWSTDGRAIVFTSGSPRNLFRTSSSGAGNEQRLTQSPVNQFSNDWSRDGRWVLYHELTTVNSRDLWFVQVTMDGRPVPASAPKSYLQTPFNESWGRFSPQSPPRWVAYESDVTGHYEIYIQSFPEPRGKFQVSAGGGRYPQWVASGRELIYLSPENKLMAISLNLRESSVEPSSPRELFRLNVADTGLSPYDTSADGQRFLVRATTGQVGQPLTVIVNWPALLRKEAAEQ